MLSISEARHDAGHDPALAIAVDPTATMEENQISVLRSGPDYLLRFLGLAEFRISADAGQVEAMPHPGCNQETLTHLLLDQVLPRVLGHRGQVVLHGGAVRVGEGAVAFLGVSGSGKSTLAASFQEAGFELLSDDGLVLIDDGNRVLVSPTYQSLRLWPESIQALFDRHPPRLAPVAHYSSKQRVAFSQATDVGPTAALRLEAIFLLTEHEDELDERVIIMAAGPAATLMALMQNAFRLDVADEGRTTRLFAAAGDMAERIPVYSLAYPRDFMQLASVRQAIVTVVKEQQ